MSRAFATTAALALAPTVADAYDVNDRYDSLFAAGWTHKYELAGALGALAEVYPGACDGIVSRVNYDEFLRVKDIATNVTGHERDEGQLAAFIGGYHRYKDAHMRLLDSRDDCAAFEASAINWNLIAPREMTPGARNLLRLSAILENNNCFYDGHIEDESKREFWEYLNNDRHQYLHAAYGLYHDPELYDEIIEAAYTEGTTDSLMPTVCAELEAFGLSLEQPDENFWNPEAALAGTER